MSIIDGEKVEMDSVFYRPLKIYFVLLEFSRPLQKPNTKLSGVFKEKPTFNRNIFTLL